MTKRNCYVKDVGIAIEKLADALDPERSKPFPGDILDLLEWAEKDALAMRQQLDETQHARDVFFNNWEREKQQLAERDAELKRISLALNDDRVDLIVTASEAITELRQQNEELMIELCRRSTK